MVPPEHKCYRVHGHSFVVEVLVAGEVDQTGHPAGMKRVASMIAGSEFAVVSGSGHYPWAENPAEFNQAFFGFLGRHFAH